MPPHIALLLCCIFCVWVIRNDAKWHPGLSPALWLPTLWIWRCASRGIGAWFTGGDPEAAEDVGWYDPVFFLLCIGAGWVVLARRNINWAELLRSNLWLLIFFGYMAVSIAWAPDVFVCSKRWVRASGDLTMALVVATHPNGPLQGIVTVLRRCGYLLVPFSIVLAKYFPDLGRLPGKHWAADEWIGVATQKNNLGMLCMVAGLWLMWEFWHWNENRETLSSREFKAKRIALVLYAAMTLYLFNGGGTARSMTSIVALAIGLLLFWQLAVWRDNPSAFRRRTAMVLGAWLLLQPGCQAVFGEPFSDYVLQAMGRDPTLTGRSQLWHDCIQLGMEHPILGAGYMGFWTDETILKIKVDNTNAPTECHNGYIEIFTQLGVVGLALFLPVIISGLIKTWRLMRADFEAGRLCVTLLIVMLIHNYSESGFPRATYLTWFVFLVAMTAAWRGAQQTAETVAFGENTGRSPDLFAEEPTVEISAT